MNPEARQAVAEGFAEIMAKRHPEYRWIPVDDPTPSQGRGRGRSPGHAGLAGEPAPHGPARASGAEVRNG